MLRQKWLHYSESHLLILHSYINSQSFLNTLIWKTRTPLEYRESIVPNLNISVELPLLLVCIHISFINTAKYLLLSCPCSPNLPHKSYIPIQRARDIPSSPESECVPKQVQESPSTEPDEKARKYCKGNFCKRFLKFRYPFAFNNHRLVVSCNKSSSTIGISGEFPQAHKKKKKKK